MITQDNAGAQPQPAQDKDGFKQARDIVLSSDKYLKADTKTKKEMLNGFFDRFGVADLKNKGITDPAKAEKYKAAFVDHYLNQQSGEKKNETSSISSEDPKQAQAVKPGVVNKGAAGRPAITPPSKAPAPAPEKKSGGSDYGKRNDGTAKGGGFLGEIKMADGTVASEISIGVEIDGKETEIPVLVSGLTQKQVDWLAEGNDVLDKKSDIAAEIRNKAVAHAHQRRALGRPVFAEAAEEGKYSPVRTFSVEEYEAGLVPSDVQYRLPDQATVEKESAVEDFSKTMDRIQRPQPINQASAEARQTIDRLEDYSTAWREDGSKPKLPEAYDTELPEHIKSMKNDLRFISGLDDGTDAQFWKRVALPGMRINEYGVEKGKHEVATAMREKLVDRAGKSYEEEQKLLQSDTEQLLTRKLTLVEAVKQLDESRAEYGDQAVDAEIDKLRGQLIPEIQHFERQIRERQNNLYELGSVLGEAGNDVQGSVENAVKEFYNNYVGNVPRMAASLHATVDNMIKAPQRLVYDAILNSGPSTPSSLKAAAAYQKIQFDMSDVSVEAMYGVMDDLSSSMMLQTDMREIRNVSRLTGQTFGQLAQMTTATALTGPMGGVTVGAALSADEMMQEALNAGLSFKDAKMLSSYYAPLGTFLEYFGANKAIGLLEKNAMRRFVIDQVLKGSIKLEKKGVATALKEYTKPIAESSLEELVTESAQFMIQDLLQRGYDASVEAPDAPKFNNPDFMSKEFQKMLGENAGGGAYGGALMATVTTLLGGRRKRFKDFKQTIKTEEGFNVLKTQIATGLARDGADQSVIDETMAQLNDAKAVAEAVPDNMSSNKQIDLFNEMMKKAEWQRRNDKSPVLGDSKKARKADDDKIQSIIDRPDDADGTEPVDVEGEAKPETKPEPEAAPDPVVEAQPEPADPFEGMTEEEIAEAERTRDDLLMEGEAKKRRDEGRFERDGVEYVRQEPIQDAPRGKKTTARFSDKVEVEAEFALMEADQVQPSHQNRMRNPMHFIPEAQPKARHDKASQASEDGFAQKPRFNELGENTNAYSGAPIVNERGEVIQGNNRAAGLRKGYAAQNPQYKADLAKNAEQFGFTSDQVQGMKNPVLVRVVKAEDGKAIELGNYDAKDLETGGSDRVDPIRITRRMPMSVKARLSAILFDGEDGTLNERIRAKSKDIIDLMKPYLNAGQMENLFKKDGSLNPRAVEDIQGIVKQFLFDGGDSALPQLYEDLPGFARQAVERGLKHIFGVPPGKSLVREIQGAVLAVNAFQASGASSFEVWMGQADMFRDGKTPKDIFKPGELAIADFLMNVKKPKDAVLKFKEYQDLVNDRAADMFEGARKGIDKDAALKQVFNTEKYEGTEQKTDDKGSADKASGKQDQAPAKAEAKPKRKEIKAPQPKKPVNEMTAEELMDFSEELADFDRNVETALWGEDRAKEYRKAQRVLNSNTMDLKNPKYVAAEKLVEEMESELSQSEQNLLFGIKESGQESYDSKEIEGIANAVDRVDAAENINDLAAAIKNSLLDLASDKNNLKAKTILNAARLKAEALGIDAMTLLDQSIKNIGKEVSDASDLMLLAQSIMKAVAASAKPAQPKQVTESKKPKQLGKAKSQQRVENARQIIRDAKKGVTNMTHAAVSLLTKAIRVPVVMDVAEFNKVAEQILTETGLDAKAARGFVYEGRVYLNPELVTKDTAVHEFAHVYLAHMKENNAGLYAAAAKLIENTPIFEAIKSNPYYKNKSRPEQIEEALAQAIGERGQVRLQQMLGSKAMVEKFKAWMDQMKAWLADNFFMSSPAVKTMTLDQFLDGAVHDLLGGKDLGITKDSGGVRMQAQIPQWYHNVENALAGISQEKANLAQWKAMLEKKGVAGTAREMSLLDFESAFAGRKSITKQEMADFINSNKIDLREVNLKGLEVTTDITADQARELIAGATEVYAWNKVSGRVEAVDPARMDTYTDFKAPFPVPTQDSALHSEYQLKGGEKYGETLVTAPGLDTEFYDKNHYPHRNLIGHMRHTERTLPDGRKAFFVEEIQSEWGQQSGKKDVPATPFAKTDHWAGLLVRAAIKKAVEVGADVVAWTTGKQQIERFEVKDSKGRVVAAPKPGLATFYDEVLPKVFEKQIRRFDSSSGKVVEVDFQGKEGEAQKQSAIEITAVAQTNVRTGGVPLFQFGLQREAEIQALVDRLQSEGYTNQEIIDALAAEGYNAVQVGGTIMFGKTIGDQITRAFDFIDPASVDLNGTGVNTDAVRLYAQKIATALSKAFPGSKVEFSWTKFKAVLDGDGVDYNGQGVYVKTDKRSGETTIYFNPATITPKTSMRVFAQAWIGAAMQFNPRLLDRMKSLVQGTTYLDQAKQRKAENPEMDAMIEAIADQALDINAQPENFRKRFKRFINSVFNAFTQQGLVRAGYWQRGNLKADEIMAMDLEQFTTMVANELTLQRKLSINSWAMFDGSTRSQNIYDSFVNAKLESDFIKLRQAIYTSLVNGQKPAVMVTFVVDKLGLAQDKAQALVDDIVSEIEVIRESEGVIPFEQGRFAVEWHQLRQWGQDSMIHLKKIQQTIEKQHGKLLADFMNPYIKQELVRSKINQQVENLKEYVYGVDPGKALDMQGRSVVFGRDKVNKASIAGRLSAKGLAISDLFKYMYALHAPERNARMKEQSQKLQDQVIAELLEKLENTTDPNQRAAILSEIKTVLSNQDSSTAIVEAGSRISDSDAQAILDGYSDSDKQILQEFADEFRREVIDKRIDLLYENDFITEQQYQALMAGEKTGSDVVWNNYVPLKIDQIFFPGQGKGDGGNARSGLQSATGRGDFSDQAVVNAVNQAVIDLAKTIQKVEMNKANLALYELAKRNPDPEVWKVHKQKGIMEFDPDTGDFKAYRDLLPDGVKERSIEVRTGEGKLVYVELVHPSLRKALLMASDPFAKVTNTAIKAAGFFTNIQRTLLTSMNVFFGFTNFARDFPDAMANIGIEKDRFDIKTIRRKVIRNLPSAAAALSKNYFAGSKEGGDMMQYLLEAKAAGMYMAWANYGEIASQIERLEKLAQDMAEGRSNDNIAKKLAQGTIDTFLGINEVFEMSNRLAVYAALRDEGVSVDASAAAAKNITLNFEKRGTGTALLNAGYLFLNAGVQGVFKTAQLLKSPTGRKTLAAAAAFGFMNKALLYGLLDEEDEEMRMMTIRSMDWKMNTYFYNPFNPSRPFKLPKPYSMVRFFQGLGENMYDVTTDRKTGMKAAADQMGIVMSVMDPVAGNQDNWVSALLPVIASQGAEIMLNRDYQMRPIVPEYNVDAPSSERYHKRTSQLFIDAAQGIARSRYGAEISPNVLEYLYDEALGGLPTEMLRVFDYANDPTQRKIRNIPIARRFIEDLNDNDYRWTSTVYEYLERIPDQNITAKEQKLIYTAYQKSFVEEKILSASAASRLKKQMLTKFGLDITQPTYEKAQQVGKILQPLKIKQDELKASQKAAAEERAKQRAAKD